MTGDEADFIARLKAVLPRNWFPDETPILDALLAGLASPWVSIFDGITFADLQTRIASATGFWLDGASADYLTAFPRRLNEPDASYSLRIRREIIRPRNTRAAIVRVLQDLTGNTPTVFRPSNVLDTGGWDGPTLGWDVAGGWGAYDLPFQAFVTIALGTAPGTAGANTGDDGISGWDSPLGGWDVGAIGWADGSPAQGAVTDADIYAAVESVTPDGHINWVAITGG